MATQNMSLECTKHYVEYLFPGSFFSESTVKEVQSRNPEEIARKMPSGAFAFSFFDQTSKEVTIDGKKKIVYGERKKESGRYYPNAQTFDIPAVKKMGKSHSTLLSNMECNNWSVVVKTCRGNFQPLEKRDHVLCHQQK